MTKLKKMQLIISILLIIALIIDISLGKGLMMAFYAVVSILIVNIFHPFFRKIFKTDLPFSITLADITFAVFGTYVGNRFDLYHTFFAYDIMLHFISGILISLTLYEVFFPSSYRNSIPLVARVSLSMIIGLAGAGFWELCEYFLDIFTGLDVQRNLVEVFKQSLLENIRAGRTQATRQQVLAAAEAAQCGDILAKLPEGLDTVIGTEGVYLSGGEAQRIALARAILKDAPIVVLDEATAFADPENEALIQKALARLTAGKTVIMIAHRLSTVVGADRIIVLDEGRAVEQGAHAELLAKGGLYAKMWADYNQSVQWKIQSGEER